MEGRSCTEVEGIRIVRDRGGTGVGQPVTTGFSRSRPSEDIEQVFQVEVEVRPKE